MDLVDRLSYLFGTEEVVQRRRESVLLREEIRTRNHNIENGCDCRVICSGSLGEGVAYPRSDDDLMYVDRTHDVHDRYEEAINHRALYMIPSVYSPGFCILQNVTTLGFPFLPSKEVREDLIQRNPSCHLHGPCASAVVGEYEYDHAECFFCPRWPAMANEWIIRRRRYGWPSPDLIATIVKAGFHVVPIGNPDSPLCDFEWRVSFSLAERSLIHAFNHVQFLVYNLLKLSLKRVIGVRVPDVLCSYFLKTVLYYTIENSSQEIWVNETIDECYGKCLLLLFHFIHAKNCPNYFVPCNNMMRRKVNDSNKFPLLSIISELMTCGIVGSLRLCDEKNALYPYLSHAHIELKNDAKFLFGDHFLKLMYDYENFICYQCGNNFLNITASNVLSPLLSRFKHLLRSTDSSFLNLIIKRVFTILGLQCIDIFSRVTVKNSSRYQNLKKGKSMLKIGKNTDVGSGRLQLANYMCMTGQYRHCLAIVQAVLSDIAPYVVECSHRSATQAMYMEVMCNNGHSLDYKVRKAWLIHVQFSEERTKFAPFPIKIICALHLNVPCVCSEFHKFLFLVHPLVFAYYLQGLSFYQTHDSDSMNNSVTLLEDSINNIHKDHLRDIFYGRILLGYMKMLQQDYYSSCRCFTSAHLMKDAMDKQHNRDNLQQSQACLILIACLVHRIVRTR